MPSAPSIRVEYRPSRWQRTLSTVLVIAAGVALAFAAWPLAARLAALVVYAGCTLFVIRRLQRTHWTAVAWAGDGSWRIALEDGKEHAAVLIEARLFGPLAALRLRAADRLFRVLLWPDSADPDDLRRLRIRLGRETRRREEPAK